jgi:hypothetical protein
MARWEDVGPNFEGLIERVPLTTAPLSNQGVFEGRDLRVGGVMTFAVTRMSDPVAGEAMVVEAYSQAVNAAVPRAIHSSVPVEAYWAPQGESIGIPAHPDLSGKPELVFTPDLSGCSVVVEKADDQNLRVSHVQGGHHNDEFVDLRIDPRKITAILAHESYSNGRNDQAAAFLKFDRGSSEWNIHWQSRQGTIHVQGTGVQTIPPAPLEYRGYGSKSAVRPDHTAIAVRDALASDRARQPNSRFRFTRSQSPEESVNLTSMGTTLSNGSRQPWQRDRAPNPRDTNPFRSRPSRDNPDTERRR